MVQVDKKRLKKFYEAEAQQLAHQESMYLKGDAYGLWWHRKRLKSIFSFLREMLKRPSVKTLVDVGCAEGYYMKLITSIQSDVHCVGADIAHTYLKKAKINVKRTNADFALCDLENLPFKDQSFDIVLCSEVLEHIPNYRRAFGELYRIARKCLVISFPGHSYIYKIMSKAETLRELIRNVIPHVGHVSEVTISDIRSLVKPHEVSVQTEVGGAIPLELYRIVPSIKLVDAIDDMICRILKRLGAVEHTTIHVMKIMKRRAW